MKTTAAGLVVADATYLPFRGEVFDAVFLVHVAGHLPEAGRRGMVSEVLRLLRPGGIVFFRAFSVEDLRAGEGEEVEPQTFRRGGGIITHYFTETGAEELFASFIPIEIRTHRWQMRVRGRDLPRAEVEAVFQKRA